MMKISPDKAGFPMASIEQLGLQCSLWPTTKWQFEKFMSDTNQYGDSYYEKLLELNPRTSIQNVTFKNYEGLFLTGILASEVLEFCKWLGEDLDLPTVKEWQRIWSLLGDKAVPEPMPAGLCEPAQKLWRLQKEKNAQGMARFCLLEGGVLEWVRSNGGFVGIGTPRSSFQPNTWDPKKDVVKILNGEERLRYLGFRVIRRTGHGLN